MLILKKADEKSNGKEIEVSILGEDVKLTIRPLNDRIIETMRKRYKKDEAFSDALIDHILVDFSGIAYEDG